MTRWRWAAKEPGRYGTLFVLLMINIVILLVVPSTRLGQLVQTVGIAVTMVMALRTSQATERVMRFALGGALVAVGIAALVLFAGLDRGAGAIYVLDAALLVITIPMILRGVATTKAVDARMVMGGLSVYLMIGLLFSFVFLGYSILSQEQFFTQSGQNEPSDYVYFSYVTMATVGYGDLTPAGDVPRMMAVVDALLGQIFLVTAVARLVATWQIGARFRPEPDE